MCDLPNVSLQHACLCPSSQHLPQSIHISHFIHHSWNHMLTMLITSNETFLSEMSKLFTLNQTKGGSIYITMKRIDNSKKPVPRPSKQVKEQDSKPIEHMCLIRVHNSSRKISTVVSSKDVNKFQQAYSNLLRGNLYGLKKKEKKKSNKKSKATQ